MMNVHWLMRMRRWVQHPPSMGRVALVFAIIAICGVVLGLERAGWLPDWFAAERVRVIR